MNNLKFITIIFSCIICDAFVDSERLEHLRIKRWEKGSMNMQGSMGTGDLSNMFRGTAGVDYPDLKTIPNTNFRCENQVYEGGLYADTETRCQVYHVCHDGRKDSFLCGKGTIFNQQILACDYWYSTDCETAPNYYYVNSQIGNSASPNNLQDSNSKYTPGSDSRRLPNTGVNNYGQNQQQPIPGRIDNSRIPNVGVDYNQQPRGTGDHRRLPNTGVNAYGHNMPQPIPGHAGDNTRIPNTNNFDRQNQQQPITGITGVRGNTGISTGSGANQYNRNNQHNIPGSTSDSRRIQNPSINSDPYSGHSQQCRCIRSSNQTPWSFPVGTVKGNDR